ncbi:MAG: hypothetical protein ACR2K5_04330 [Pseudolabrys sp.]
MNPNALTKDYRLLKAGERFALILNANDRGDDAEVDRLASSAPRIAFTTYHHQPFAHAFREVSALWFLELLDASAEYLSCLDLSYLRDEHSPRLYNMALAWGTSSRLGRRGGSCFANAATFRRLPGGRATGDGTD